MPSSWVAKISIDIYFCLWVIIVEDAKQRLEKSNWKEHEYGESNCSLLLPSICSPFPLVSESLEGTCSPFSLFSKPRRNPAEKRIQETGHGILQRELKVRLNITDALQNSLVRRKSITNKYYEVKSWVYKSVMPLKRNELHIFYKI